MKSTAVFLVRLLPAADALALACLLALFTRPDLATENAASLLVLILVVPVTQFFLKRVGVYDSHRVAGAGEVERDLLVGHLLAACVILPCAAAAGQPRSGLRDLLYVFASSFALLAATRITVYLVLRRLRRRGFDVRRVLFVGTWEQAEAFAPYLPEHPEWGLKIDCVATGDADAREFLTFPDRQPIGNAIEAVLKTRVVDEVLIHVGPNSLPRRFEEASRYEEYGLVVRAVVGPPNPNRERRTRSRIEDFVGVATLPVADSPRTEDDLLHKRIFDLVLGGALFLAALPLMTLIAALVKLTSRGPVLFVQTRAGLNGRTFRMLKFRTMVDGAELLARPTHRSITRGPIFKDPEDVRVTPLGRLLRRFSLDELPQLWNVLRGDMSLVGPRPLPVYEAEQISGPFRRRFSVPPGLTCIWQVSGRSDVAYETWMQYDLQYVDRWSLWHDTVLLLRTVSVVFSGRGGY